MFYTRVLNITQVTFDATPKPLYIHTEVYKVFGNIMGELYFPFFYVFWDNFTLIVIRV